MSDNDTMTITGTVETVLPLQTFDSGFTKRVLVVNTGEPYPQTIPVEFTKDNTSKLDGLTEGQDVTVAINLRGNEYKGKYYANIQGWKLDAGEPVSHEPSAAVAGADDANDDIPF